MFHFGTMRTKFCIYFSTKQAKYHKKLNIVPTNENLSKHKVVEMGPP
jgi:hypothetical protein